MVRMHDVAPGTVVTSVLRDMVSLAAASNEVITARYGGRTLTVSPGDTVDSALFAYEHGAARVQPDWDPAVLACQHTWYEPVSGIFSAFDGLYLCVSCGLQWGHIDGPLPATGLQRSS